MKNVLKTVICIFSLAFFLTVPATCQFNNHLILKKGPKTIKNYIAGDNIILQLNGFKTPVEAQLLAIGEDYIIIKEEPIPLKDITGIIKVRALHYKEAGTILKFAGPTLIFLDGFNSLIRNFRPLFGNNILIAGTLIFGSGFLLPLLQTKVYNLYKQQYYLRIVPSDPETYRNLKNIRD